MGVDSRCVELDSTSSFPPISNYGTQFYSFADIVLALRLSLLCMPAFFYVCWLYKSFLANHVSLFPECISCLAWLMASFCRFSTSSHPVMAISFCPCILLLCFGSCTKWKACLLLYRAKTSCSCLCYTSIWPCSSRFLYLADTEIRQVRQRAEVDNEGELALSLSVIT